MNTLTHANFYFPARVSKFKFVVGKEALGGTLPPQIPREHNPPPLLPALPPPRRKGNLSSTYSGVRLSKSWTPK